MVLQLLAVALAKDELIKVHSVLGQQAVNSVKDFNQALAYLIEHPNINVLLLDMDDKDLAIALLTHLFVSFQSRSLSIIFLGNSEVHPSVSQWTLAKPLNRDALTKVLNGIQENQKMTIPLEQQASLFNAIFWQAPIGIAISHGIESLKEGEQDIFRINPAFEAITGYNKEELQSIGWASITHPDDLEEDQRQFQLLKAGKISSYSMEKRYIKRDGSFVWVHMVVAPLSLGTGGPSTHICLVQDLSKRFEIQQSLAESERSKEAFLANLPGMAYRCKYDAQWTMLYVSEGCTSLTGYQAKQLLYNSKLSFNDLIEPEYRDQIVKLWDVCVQKHVPFRHEYEISTAQGSRKWVWEVGQVLYGDDGAVEALEGIILDISDRKLMEEKLVYQDEHDIATGLFNRRYLESVLRKDKKSRKNIKRALVSVNVSALHAKSITYGHQYSQDLMTKIAGKLSLLCTDQLLLCLTHEYRFVFYYQNYKDRQALLTLCQKIDSILQTLLPMEQVQWGLGVLQIDQSGKSSVEQLLRNLLVASERSMSLVNQDEGPCFFDQIMEDQLVREQMITEALQHILTNQKGGSLFLQFQPIFDLKSNEIVGFEALSRLSIKTLGTISPVEFIPITEKTKMIIDLGLHIFKQALAFLKLLQKHGYTTLSVSINISAIQLLNPDFSKNILQSIKAMRVDPSLVILEITESIFSSNYQEINRILGLLQEQGIKIAVDDFGTGYSSLARERELHINTLKIDKFFIDKLLELSDDQAITGDIVSMAHKLGHTVIAEGIEYPKQLSYLRRVGCDMMQGYLLSRPIDPDAALELLKSYDVSLLL